MMHSWKIILGIGLLALFIILSTKNMEIMYPAFCRCVTMRLFFLMKQRLCIPCIFFLMGILFPKHIHLGNDYNLKSFLALPVVVSAISSTAIFFTSANLLATYII